MKLWLTFYLLVVRADKDNMNWSFKYKFKVLALQYFPFLCNLNLQLKTRLDWEVEKMNDARWSCSVVRSYGSRQHMKLLTQVQTQSRRRASCLFINLCVIPAAWGGNAAVQLRPLRQHTDLHRQPETDSGRAVTPPSSSCQLLFISFLSDDQVFDCSNYYLSKKKTQQGWGAEKEGSEDG